MQEATFLILTALASGTQHGYGIISDVADIRAAGSSCWPGRCIPPWNGFARTG